MEDDRFVDSVRKWVNNGPYTHPKLERDEFDALNSFALLWSVFEGYVCGSPIDGRRKSLNLSKLNNYVVSIEQQLNAEVPQQYPQIITAFHYFQSRYIANCSKGDPLHGLRFSNAEAEYKDTVLEILKASNSSLANILKALLFIIYRLRNNLFHGVKWAQDQGMHDQQRNFEHAARVLMAVMDISEGRAPP